MAGVAEVRNHDNSSLRTSSHVSHSIQQDETSEADVLEQPQTVRTTRSGLSRGANPSPPRGGGRMGRGAQRGGRAPITWSQDGQMQQQLGGK